MRAKAISPTTTSRSEPVCPALCQDGVCRLQLEACYAKADGDPCPFECDACRDVSPDIDDEGTCENCRES
jgi:hypothetical protein